jgi:hypothetical protein
MGKINTAQGAFYRLLATRVGKAKAVKIQKITALLYNY